MSTIKSVCAVIENDVLSMAGGAMINPPSTMFQNIDQELTSSGDIQQGDFVAHVKEYGFKEERITGTLSDEERQNVINSLFPHNNWVCAGRMTEMTRYNIVIEF
ncbi:MAG: hypothetical protein KKE44_06035 [Proteobacteria bacterium]|nr:hypothetical protein [Pseudomonadota bacterium]MBU1582288.1 hypothetical protein [Pseudomonadota bacterium]